jgi:hypothetical protein
MPQTAKAANPNSLPFSRPRSFRKALCLLITTTFSGSNFQSLSEILVGVANPVEPFGFMLIQDGLPPPLMNGIRKGLRKQKGLFDQLDQGQ